MRLRLAGGGGGGGGKEAACMSPTGKPRSPGRGFPSRAGVRRPRRGHLVPGSAPQGRHFFLTAQSSFIGERAVGSIPMLGGIGEVSGGIRCHIVRLLRETCLGPGKSDFSAPRRWKALDFTVTVTAAGSRGQAQSQYALPPARLPLRHPSHTRSIPRRLLLGVHALGEAGGSRRGKGAGAAWGRTRDEAGEAGAPGPGAEEGERRPRNPGSPGYCRVRSRLQTLASRMPSVDERCIME